MIFGNNVLDAVPPTGPIRIWDAGVQWCDLEKHKGEYDWSKLDRLIDRAGNRSIMLVLGHPPLWAAKGGSDGRQAAWMPQGSNRPPMSISLWRGYVGSIVRRYRGIVNQYQVWNEPVDKRFYSGSYSELSLMTSEAYNVVKHIDNTIKVVSPPLQPRRQAGWNTKGRLLFSALKSSGFPFDIWSCHIYPQIGEGIDAWKRDVYMVKNRIKGVSKPLWITETNFNLGDYKNNPLNPLKQQGLIYQVRSVSEELGVARVYWYAHNYSNPQLLGITV